MKKHLILIILLSAVLSGSAYETRTWEDVDGNKYTGHFLRELFGKLTIECEDGKLVTLRLQNLSDIDKKYIRVKVPPKVEAVVTKKTTTPPPRTQGLYSQPVVEDIHQLTIKIIKKSQRPFTSRLNAELFIIGEEVESTRNNILLSRTQYDFLLTEENDYIHEFKSNLVNTTSARVIDWLRGETYQGYLLIITSLNGDPVLMDSTLPSWSEDPDVLDRLRELAMRGAPSRRSRHFDNDGNKVVSVAPPVAHSVR